MSNEDILAQWQADTAGLATVRNSGLWNNYPGTWQEITLPFSTLTNKFVRVFMQRHPAGHLLLCDHKDLSEDNYDIGDTSSALMAATALLRRELGTPKSTEKCLFAAFGAVWCQVNDDRLLTFRLFDMGQLLQQAVNLAVLEREGWNWKNEAIR